MTQIKKKNKIKVGDRFYLELDGSKIVSVEVIEILPSGIRVKNLYSGKTLVKLRQSENLFKDISEILQ